MLALICGPPLFWDTIYKAVADVYLKCLLGKCAAVLNFVPGSPTGAGGVVLTPCHPFHHNVLNMVFR
jgi:hypothetical protein